MSIREHLAQLRDFWAARSPRLFVLLSAAFLGIGIGSYVVCVSNPELTEEIVAYLQEIVAKALDSEGNISFWSLLYNNWIAMCCAVFYGVIPFLFLPAVSLVTNATILGAMAAYYKISGISLVVFFAGILPHGILEIPALLLSIMLGIMLCSNVILFFFRSSKRMPFSEFMANVFRTLLFVIFPLLLLAALIEAYITPVFMSMFM